LPEVDGDEWSYSGSSMAYYPGGDADGPDDGYPGSLFATGHDQAMQVAEISIPAPVVSAGKDTEDLNRATMLQNFHDVLGGFGVGDLELPRVGFAYLPAQGGQESDKLYFCWDQHAHEGEMVSHGWSELDLSDPRVAGGWSINGFSSYSTTDYMSEIPEDWSATYTPGKRLATGRYRDGGWSGQGPSLLAIGPWNEGNPPEPGTDLDATALIYYTPSDDFAEGQHTMSDYHHSDEWSGAAWLTSGDSAAVVFVGTKGHGEYWYGFANGVVWPDEAPYPDIPDPPNDDRGWWSNSFSGQMIFYDPADLAVVAQGEMEPHEPQPYAVMELDEHLFAVDSPQKKSHLGAADFDRERGLLYIFEPLVKDEESIVHVWKVG
jgi:hypothetical protein